MRGEDGISHPRRFDCSLHIVRAQDVRTFKNQNRMSGEISVEPVGRGCVVRVLCQHAADK